MGEIILHLNESRYTRVRFTDAVTGMPVRSEPEIYVCRDCGLVVADQERHDPLHPREESTDDPNV